MTEIINNYEDYDALALAALVRTKQITASELLETAIKRVEQFNPKLNAVVSTLYEQAYKHCDAIDLKSSFAGVPFLLKDLDTDYAGTITTHGSHFFKNNVADYDSEIVARFKQAGLTIFAKTNVPEFGLSYVTESNLLGICRNPWDLTRTPGGSSGGAAAAVACRIVPIAHASDGGGSIRVPAACCGLFGLKPTRGRVSTGPLRGEAWSGLGVAHALSMTVRDSAALLDAVSGYALGDPYCAPTQCGSFLSSTQKSPGQLKIAVCTEAGQGIPVANPCIAATNDAAALCQQLGHHVEMAMPTYNTDLLAHSYHIIVATNTLMSFRMRAQRLGREPRNDEIEGMNYMLANAAKEFSSTDYALAFHHIYLEARKIAKFFLDYDILLTPTTAQLPLHVGELKQVAKQSVEQYFKKLIAFCPFTSLWNQTGQPAMSVPLYWTHTGLPVGVQFIGRFGAEATLFSLAAQLEQARPWQACKPTIITSMAKER